VQFYSEVLAFAFFTAPSAAGSGPMLPSPFALLGARRYMRDITGESSPGAPCGSIHAQDWLNEELTQRTQSVPINGKDILVVASAFIAVSSACSGCLAGDMCSMKENVNNLCDTQRRHLDEDISRWYQAYEPTMYAVPVQEAVRRVIRRIGTGPWGAGVWYGDSQQYFLTVWLATSLLKGTTLDYYVYDHFCENPGNQCFVLGARGCSSCIAASKATSGVNASRCGMHSLHDMVRRFQDRPVQALYSALSVVPGPPGQVFDLLANT